MEPQKDSGDSKLGDESGIRNTQRPTAKVLCPFKVGYPDHPEFEACSAYDWKHLREHLVRRKHRSRDVCPSCGEIFSDHVNWEQHIAEAACEVNPTINSDSTTGVRRDQAAEINNLVLRGRRAAPIEELYGDLWAILFGNDHTMPEPSAWLKIPASIEGLRADEVSKDARADEDWSSTSDTAPATFSHEAEAAGDSSFDSPKIDRVDDWSKGARDLDQSSPKPLTVLGNDPAQERDDVDPTPRTDVQTIAATSSNTGDIHNPNANDSDNDSIIIESDQSSSQSSKAHGKSLAQDLDDVDSARGIDEYTDPTSASNAVKNAGINDSAADGDDTESKASTADRHYSHVSALISRNLAQHLRDVDLSRFEDMLARRLEEFSLRLGNESDSERHLTMMSIVFRRASKIASKICHDPFEEEREDSLSASDGASSEDSKAPGSSSAINSKSSLTARERNFSTTEWVEKLKLSGSQHNPHEIDDALALDSKELLASQAYQWLVSVVQRSSLLDGIEPICMLDCRDAISKQIQRVTDRAAQKSMSHRLVTSKRQPPIYRATFNLLSWNLLTFLREECEGENPEEVVGHVVTFTGDGHSVQAETCRGYLEQVWPTTGSEFMNLVEDLVRRAGQACKRVLPDRTEVSAKIQDNTCVVSALGTQSGLCDVAEQLLWVSTALRSPSDKTAGMTLRSAALGPPSTLDHGTIPIYQADDKRCLGQVNFDVVHTEKPPSERHGSAEGNCWMELFPSCPVTNGYPIPSRTPQRPGLELPLDIMVSLIGADRVTSFGHDLIIKGYSDLFYATEHNEGCIMWHLICNKRNPNLKSGFAQISFADRRIPRPTDQRLSLLQPSDMLHMRHIIGWTTTVRSNAGAPDVDYALIAPSRLEEPSMHSGWALERIAISVGKYVTIGGSIVPISQRKEVLSQEDDYTYRLLNMRKRMFLFCDVKTRKLWLVNGLSTLLHLVRSHLTDAEKDDCHEMLLISKAGDIKAERGRSGRKAALATLRLDSNRRLRLHRKEVLSMTGKPEQDGDYYRLEDLIKFFLHVLEQILGHQSDYRHEEASVGYRITRSPWNLLQGYDFMDVATKEPSIPAREMILDPNGEGWVQFTRALDAPTLFGKNFGDMLEPVKPDPDGSWCSKCLWNGNMPEGRDLLAVQVEDLLKVGEKEDSRLLFNRGVCMDISPRLFEPCRSKCRGTDRIGQMQRASRNERLPPASQTDKSTGLLSKLVVLLRRKPKGGEATGGTDETRSSSGAIIPSTGAVILGIPREPSKPFWQKVLCHQDRPHDRPAKVASRIDDQLIATASSDSNDTTTDNLDTLSSHVQTESTDPTHLSSLGLLSTSVGAHCSPESSVSPSIRPPRDDGHPKNRAEHGVEEGKFRGQGWDSYE